MSIQAANGQAWEHSKRTRAKTRAGGRTNQTFELGVLPDLDNPQLEEGESLAEYDYKQVCNT
jgi:hypothetical protein